MSIDWRTPAGRLQTALAPQSGLPAGEVSTGQSLLTSLNSAGATYDANGNDSSRNTSAYAQTFQNWWNVTAAPAWAELDRICRLVYATAFASSLQLPGVLAFGTSASFGTATSPFTLPGQVAAFGIPAAAKAVAWQAGTNYGPPNIVNAFVSPSPPNGFYYVGTVNGGTTSGAQPAWPTTLGATVNDGTQTWQCVVPVLAAPGPSVAPPPAGTAVTLVPDASLGTQTALSFRASVAATLAPSVGTPGLAGLLSQANAAWTAAVAARPTPNPGIDATSTAAINSLNLAIANANAWLQNQNAT
jgi:hypothetical protein